jgi:transposase
MTYSIDLRERVVAYVRNGGSKAEASRRFSVNTGTIFNWLKREDLQPKPYERTKHRKVDWDALRRDVELHPDKLLRERAIQFGVHAPAIWHALRQMQLTHKKSS